MENIVNTIQRNRKLGAFKGKKGNPTVIAIGGIHGNENAGYIALTNVIDRLKTENIEFLGNFYALAGNLKAISQNVRFNTIDLNRIWNEENLIKYKEDNSIKDEYLELIELYNCIKDIVNKEKGPFIFIDLHTTSSKTQPFITISDALNNRKFSSNFPLPVILGIEEFLDGPLLSFINKYGHTAIGFEGGQHSDKKSIMNCESFMYLALVASKCIKKKQLHDFKVHEELFLSYQNKKIFYEIKYKYDLKGEDNFIMLKGFSNFDEVYTNQLLAYSNGKTIKSPFAGSIFLPLYQNKGEEGFFIIRRVSSYWLFISKYLRKLIIHALLRLLPGVKKHKVKPNTLVINPKVASFFTTDFFHLFGYRKKTLKNNEWNFTKRDRKIRKLP